MVEAPEVDAIRVAAVLLGLRAQFGVVDPSKPTAAIVEYSDSDPAEIEAKLEEARKRGQPVVVLHFHVPSLV